MKSRLDYSGILHCALMNDNFINTFRMSIALKDKVKPELLQCAVDELTERYPLFFCRITKDKYWYYVEHLYELQVEQDKGPFLNLNHINVYDHAVAVLYHDKTISIEVFHSVTDGIGALTVFKKLIEKYIKLSLYDFVYEKKKKYKQSELEDSFKTIDYTPYQKSMNKTTKSFQFQKKNPNSSIKIKKYILDLKEVKSYCKHNNYKVNELILSLFYKAISSIKKDNKDISILSPVNLRNLFHSETLRGFTLCASLTLSDDYKNESYNQLVKIIRNQMNQQKTEYFGSEILRISKLYNHFLVKRCPLWLKEKLIRIVYRLTGETSCMTVSNLGKVIFDDEMNYIESLEFVLSPRYSTPINCGVVSMNNQLVISITHDGNNNDLFEAIENELKYLDLYIKS